MKVCRVEEMRDMDRRAVEMYGISEDQLMENAGLALYSIVQREVGISGKKFAIVCGAGNNGGDGLVVARKIYSNAGYAVVLLLADPAGYKGASARNFNIAQKEGVDLRRIKKSNEIEAILGQCDVVIDAIFGTGLTRKVSGIFAEAIEQINTCGKPVFSMDIPSGISGNTGRELGSSVHADRTVTFGLPKIGNLLYPGFERNGRLTVSHISFPPELYTRDDLLMEINIPIPLPPRQKNGHKGTFGDVLFIAGAAGYYGAPIFAALSFLKAGGGYSRLASPAQIIPFLASGGGEIVFVPQESTPTGSIAKKNASDLIKLSETVDMVILGSGISLNPETQSLVRDLIANINRPLLIDGDGLTAIAGSPGILCGRKAYTILTPHVGEMARLTNESKKNIEENRVEVLQNLTARLNSTIVLKGAHSLIGYPDGRIFINLTGNPGMATAGSGDVLTGAIAAAFGLGLPVDEAARIGVLIHGLAGDIAASQIGEDGVIARDILNSLPEAVKEYRSTGGEVRDRLERPFEILL